MDKVVDIVFYAALALYFFGVPFQLLELIIAICAAIKAVSYIAS